MQGALHKQHHRLATDSSSASLIPCAQKPSVRISSYDSAPASGQRVVSSFGPCFSNDVEVGNTRQSFRYVSRQQDVRVSLQRRVKAHSGAVSAACVLEDARPDFKQIATAGMDKSIANWELLAGQAEQQLHVLKLEVPGGPVFSLAPITPLTGCSNGPEPVSLYCGTAGKEVIGYVPSSAKIILQVRLNGHTGWVRSLAKSGKYLLSCGCNQLWLWDTTYAVPKVASAAKLFTGDILAIATSKAKVFTGGADGSLRSFNIVNGKLVEGRARAKAHDGRVTGCVVHNSFVYTVSFDGHLKGWSADTLELVMEVKAAHNGTKVHCICVGPDGGLYTGGDDKLVRRWHPALLESAGEPLPAHDAGVRVLAAGPQECLVSGDADGQLSIWNIQREALPLAPAVEAEVLKHAITFLSVAEPRPEELCFLSSAN